MGSFEQKSMRSARLSFVLILSSQLFNSEPVQSVFHGDVCWYTCTKSGGCKVEYRGPQRRGGTNGTCSPATSGRSSCSGTPKECKDCSDVTKCDDSVDEERELEQSSQSLEEVTSQEVSLVKKVSDEITCVTTCDNWPYKNCKVGSIRRCARIPRGCERCDNTCAIRDGKRSRL